MLSKSLIQFSAYSWGCAHSLRQPSPGVCSLCARPIGSKDRANGGLLQVDISHTPHLPGLLLPEPLSPWEATAELCLCRRPSNTHRQGWLSLFWGHCSFPGSWHGQVLFVPSKSLQLSPFYHLVVASPLFLDMGYLFFSGFQQPPVNSFSAPSCTFGVLSGKDEHTSFYSAVYIMSDSCNQVRLL